MLKEEPIGNTCPDIDRVIETLREIVKEIESVDETEDLDWLLYSWGSQLKVLYDGRLSELEQLRNANSELRSWGWDNYNLAKKLMHEVSVLEEEITEQEDTIDDLRQEIVRLETEKH